MSEGVTFGRNGRLPKDETGYVLTIHIRRDWVPIILSASMIGLMLFSVPSCIAHQDKVNKPAWDYCYQHMRPGTIVRHKIGSTPIIITDWKSVAFKHCYNGIFGRNQYGAVALYDMSELEIPLYPPRYAEVDE